jgi:lysophospholipase L1-like esterase
MLEGDTIHHAGFSGKTAEFLAKTIDSIYAAFPADIVLLHSGHNHFVEESPIAGIIQAHKKIIQLIKSRNPRAVIFVAGVITSGKLPKYEYIPALDQEIEKMVNEMQDTSIVFIDQRQHWDWNIHTIADKVHPNKAGALVIANNWLNAIRKKVVKQM